MPPPHQTSVTLLNKGSHMYTFGSLLLIRGIRRGIRRQLGRGISASSHFQGVMRNTSPTRRRDRACWARPASVRATERAVWGALHDGPRRPPGASGAAVAAWWHAVARAAWGGSAYSPHALPLIARTAPTAALAGTLERCRLFRCWLALSPSRAARRSTLRRTSRATGRADGSRARWRARRWASGTWSRASGSLTRRPTRAWRPRRTCASTRLARR